MGESGHPPSNVYRLGEDAERAEDARGHPCLSVCLTQLCLSLRWNFHKIASSDDFTIAASKPSVLLAVRMNAKSRLVRRKCFGKRGKLNFGCPKEVRPPRKSCDSTCFRNGSKFRCIRSTPTEIQSMSENDFELTESLAETPQFGMGIGFGLSGVRLLSIHAPLPAAPCHETCDTQKRSSRKRGPSPTPTK